LEVAGVRGLSGDTFKLRQYWKWIFEQEERVRDRPFVMIGDFNVQERYATSSLSTRMGCDGLRELVHRRKWRYAVAELGGKVFRGNGIGARIDYAFLSPTFSGKLLGATHPRTAGAALLAGPAKTSAGLSSRRLSDHAPVLLEVG
jgi:exonuclease III